MKKITTITIANLIALNTFAYDYTPMVTKLKGHSEQVVMMLGEEAKYNMPIKSVSEAFSVNHQNFNDLASSVEFSQYRQSNQAHEFESALNKYKQSFKNTMEQNAFITNVSDGVSVLVKGGFAVAGGTFGGGVGVAAGLAIGDAIYEKSLGKVTDSFKESNVKLAESFLAGYLKQQVGENRLKNLTPKKLRRLNKRYDLVRVLRDKAICDSCEPGEESLIQGAAIQMITDLSEGNANSINSLKNAIKNHTGSIEQTAKELIDFKEQFEAIAQINARAIDDLFENQRGINNRLNVISNRVSSNTANIARNAKDIKFLQDVVFSKASPSQKLAAYYNGSYGEDLDGFKIGVLKSQVAFRKNLGNLVNGANQIVGIAQGLGMSIPSDVMNAVDFGTKAYTAIDGALGNVMSGNYIGAALSLTSAFGKVSSPGAARHAQVMEALAVINRKLDQVLSNQQVMLENQRVMIENQREIFEKLMAISTQIQKSTEELFNQGLLTRLDIRISKDALSELLSQSIGNCKQFVDIQTSAIYTNLELSPYQRRKESFDSHYFSGCKDLVTKMARIRWDGKFSVTFSEVLNNGGGAEYKKDYYDVYVRALHTLAKDKNIINKLMMFGSEHVLDVYSLKTYFERLKGVSEEKVNAYIKKDL